MKCGRARLRTACLSTLLGVLCTFILPAPLAAADPTQGCYYFENCTWVFSRGGAYAYADHYWNRRNPNYDSYGNNCTNFSSQVWANGAGVPKDPYDPYWWENYGDARNWQTAKGFRTFWDDRDDDAYYLVTRDIQNHFNGASVGDVIVYDVGKGQNISWTHTAVEHHWDGNGDFEAQNTKDEVVPWNRWYYVHSAKEQYWQRQHGYRIIGPEREHW